jgi:uncharacterized DUF497 family protein
LHEDAVLESERFEWDDRKADANLRKHKVSFQEAATVFEDKLGVEIDDLVHSWDESRQILIGASAWGKVLLVIYVERLLLNGRELYRIISARKATPSERSIYEAQR